MKNLLLSSGFFIVLLSGCYKYEDGPSFSILSSEIRLKRTWYYSQRTDLQTGVVQQCGFEGWEISFLKDNTFQKKTFYLNAANVFEEKLTYGTWKLIGDNYLKITEDGLEKRFYNIKRLTRKELRMEDHYEYVELVSDS